jgi:hypothetical protein
MGLAAGEPAGLPGYQESLAPRLHVVFYGRLKSLMLGGTLGYGATANLFWQSRTS